MGLASREASEKKWHFGTYLTVSLVADGFLLVCSEFILTRKPREIVGNDNDSFLFNTAKICYCRNTFCVCCETDLRCCAKWSRRVRRSNSDTSICPVNKYKTVISTTSTTLTVCQGLRRNIKKKRSADNNKSPSLNDSLEMAIPKTTHAPNSCPFLV